MQLHFLTFGGPTENYRAAVKRLQKEAEDMNVFSSITALTDLDLKEETLFWEKHGPFIQSNPRGFGYWIWKPYLIIEQLKKIPDGDVLLYMDAGCELNPFAKGRFFELVKKTNAKKIIATHSISTDITYTKQDTIFKMGMSDKPELLQKNQMQAGCLMMLKCDEIMDLASKWYEWVQDYHLIDDSTSVLPNHTQFVEHRHDQSVFNLLVKSRDLVNYDMEPADNKIENPIWYCRNRNSESIILEKPF
jgi:hypothetical protein